MNFSRRALTGLVGVGLVTATVGVWTSSTAHAQPQNWPNKPVRTQIESQFLLQMVEY